MPRSAITDAIVLRTYDVGEADRYCILLTRRWGRLAARASGARRPGSRLGPSLLPLRHVPVHLKESSCGWIIAGVQPAMINEPVPVQAFVPCMEGVELLLRLTQDEESLPEVFDATLALLEMCVAGVPEAPLQYTVRLLHLLGFLPELEVMERFVVLSDEEKAFAGAALEGRFSSRAPAVITGLRRVCSLLLRDHLTGPLKVPDVREAMGRNSSV